MSSSTAQLISIENFDQHTLKQDIITSPRSIEACKREGINPQDLIIRNIDNITEIFSDNIRDKYLLEQRVQVYETKRLEKIKLLKQTRQQVIKDEKDGLWKNPALKGENEFIKSVESEKLIQEERKQLDIIKQRQQKEIQQMIDYEIKMAEINKENHKKLAEQTIKQKERLLILEQKRKEQDEERRKKEEEKKIRQRQEEIKLQKQIEEKKLREEIRQKQKEEKMQEKERIAKEKEEIAKQKREELQQVIEENQRKREKELEERKKIMEQKELERKLGLEKKRQELIERARELQELHQERIQLAKEKNEIELEKKKERYGKKQIKLEEKRLQFEQQLENERQLAREKAEEQKLLISKVLEQNEQKEKQKKEEYLQKQKIAEERKQEIDRMFEDQKKIKVQMEQEKEEERKQVKEKKEKLELNKKMTYLKQFELAKERLEQAQQRQVEELKQRQNDNIIKQKEKLDTVQCIIRKREYHQEKLKEKLFRGTQKAFALKKQMDDILNLRSELRKEIDLNKRNIMDKFSKIKQGKIDPDVLTEFGLGDKATQLIKAIKEARNWNPQENKAQGEQQQEKTYEVKRNYIKRQTRNQQINTSEDFKKQQSTSLLPAIEQPNESTFKSSTPQRSQKSFKQQQMAKTFSGDREKKNTMFKITRNKSNVVANSQAAREFLKKYNSFGPNITEKQAQEIFNEYQTSQNTEMLRLLETEQQKQSRRDTQLEQCLNPLEKKKLEKQFIEEKEKAVMRVNTFIRETKATTTEFAKKLGIVQKF